MKKKLIKELSGIDTQPFKRYSTNIPLDDLIDTLTRAKIFGESRGYSDLEVHISQDSSLIDIQLFGKTEFTLKELKEMDRIDVILRKKEKTFDGLTRDELFGKLEK